MANNRNRELRSAIEAYFAEIGATCVEFGRGGKHDFVTFLFNGLILRQTFTTTPSDHRYIKNTMRDLKRHVREALDRKAKPRA
jgi:hypothetical protein